ncbi:MAG: hypothetical protein IKL82_00525 [Clostridia bacterium]|nr:hypothetical protein [Clostridia bacterium]
MKTVDFEKALNKSTMPSAKLTVIYYALPCLLLNVIWFWLYDVDTVVYYLDFIGVTLLDTIQAIICIVISVATFKADKTFIGVLLCVKRANKDIEWFQGIGYGFGVDGEQNVGKSFLLAYIASVLAPERFKELQVSYYEDLPFVTQLAEDAKDGEDIPYIVFKSRRDAINFYAENPGYYPCLYTANGLKLNGLKSYVLFREHLTGEQRQAENAVNVHDEVALMFPNTQRTTANEEDDVHNINGLNENTSTERQRYGGINLLSEQRFGEVNISLRTTTNVKRHCIAREKIYSPELISKLIEKLEKKILKEKENTTTKLSKTKKFLEKLEQKIGFQCVYFIDEVGSEKVGLQSSVLRTMLLKCEVAFEYYHRFYIKEYKAIKQKLTKDKFKTENVNTEEVATTKAKKKAKKPVNAEN